MKFSVLFFLILFLISCDKKDIPDLPDNIDTSESDIDTISFDNEDFSDDDNVSCEKGIFYLGNCVKSYIAVAQTEGYYKPFSGHFYLAEEKNFEELKEITMPFKTGSEKGTDLNIATSNDRIIIIGRDGADSLAVFSLSDDKNYEFTEIKKPKEGYFNFHDAVYNSIEKTYIITANQHSSLFQYENSYEEIDLSDFYDKNICNPSPSRAFMINRKLFVSLQCLDNSFISRAGIIAVFDFEKKSAFKIELPIKNPYSKFDYNPLIDKKHIYFTASGSWETRDGALLRISIKDFSVETVLKESDKKGNLLNVDFVDVSVTNSGEIFMIVSDNTEKWVNKIIKIDTKNGIAQDFDKNINAFAATPMDYSPITDTLYYFRDNGSKTELIAYNVSNKKESVIPLEYAPAALRVFIRKIEKKEE